MKSFSVFAAASMLVLAACSAPSDGDEAGPTATESAVATTDDSALNSQAGAPAGSGTPATSGSTPPGNVLALEGLGDLVIGQPIPSGSSFAERGAQIPGSDCRTASSPRYPSVYALIEKGEVRRITVGGRSDVKLVEGIGVGATDKDVLAAFPGFRASPHKYVDAPAKYLTQPGNDPRLRFEIGENGRVSLMHAGMMPQLGYVEGCA